MRLETLRFTSFVFPPPPTSPTLSLSFFLKKGFSLVSRASMRNKKDQFNMADLPGAAAAAADRDGIVNPLKRKLQSLAGLHSDVVEPLSTPIKKRVEFLREIQTQHNDLEAKFFEERSALEAKYRRLYEPLYSKRYEIVNGEIEVDEGVSTEKEKGVPEFWLNAMKTNEIISEEITDRDERALKYLKDIKCCRIEEDPKSKGFKLEFFFDTNNPYFKNSVLTKTYHMMGDDDKKPILQNAIGTKIKWRRGKKLTQTVHCESFFNFFNTPPQVPDEDDDDDEAQELQDQMEQDCYVNIASTIRDKIVPNAVSWFTGEVNQRDEFEEEIDGDDDAEDGHDDEDEVDDEDDKDEGKTIKKSKKSGRGQLANERPPECNQQ